MELPLLFQITPSHYQFYYLFGCIFCLIMQMLIFCWFGNEITDKVQSRVMLPHTYVNLFRVRRSLDQLLNLNGLDNRCKRKNVY